MIYKSTNVETLRESLKKDEVIFEYTKKDGTVRTARGTMNPEMLPEQIPDTVTFECGAINTLMKVKNIDNIGDYARGNGLVLKGIDLETEGGPKYVFTPMKRKIKENQILYYDLEKDTFRSFLQENFLGIVDITVNTV